MDKTFTILHTNDIVIGLDGGTLTVESYRLHAIDDSIEGDRAIADKIDELKASVMAAVFASRGYRTGSCARYGRELQTSLPSPVRGFSHSLDP